MNNKHEKGSSTSFSARLICLILAGLMVLGTITLLLSFVFESIL